MKNSLFVIDGIEVTILRKRIKNVHLRIYPPDGRLFMSVPNRTSERHIRQILADKLPWIKAQQNNVVSSIFHNPKRFINGETHYFLGQPYDLQLIHSSKTSNIYLVGQNILIMDIPPDWCAEYKQQLLDQWYRQQLKQLLPDLIHHWELIIGKTVREWGIKKMKTRWGTCNPAARRIWLNLELAKRPLSCLNYIVVHEMVHFFERSHNERFTYYMDQFMPEWRLYDVELKAW